MENTYEFAHSGTAPGVSEEISVDAAFHDAAVSEKFIRTEAAKEKNEKENLLFFMENEAHDAEFYRILAAKCGGMAVKKTFFSISLDECRHLKKLQTVYFLLYGDSFIPNISVKPVKSTLAALRERYIAESEGEKAYMKAAMETENKRVRSVYIENAADERHHADEIAAIIEKIMN